ncbi:unnamed protein product [Lactuca virosa]|uniref:UBA domain-containing protein n=1 Tax=Lactuca virosa TaxID=75947 RepID=A0AAU9MGW7_9ASTR|nr:unnamed protein product [Lactuca virosa]
MPRRPKTKRIRYASEAQDSKYPTQKAKVSRTIRYGKCRELGHNKLSCKSGEGPSDHVPKRKSGRPKGDEGGNSAMNIEKTPRKAGEGKKKVVEGTSKEAIGGKKKAVEGISKEASEGKMKVVEGTLKQAVVLTCHEKIDQEDFETIKDLQASGYDHGEIVEAFNKLTKERNEMLVESIVDEETIQETQDPLVRKRKPSERIIKIKLKKAVHDPDGGGSTTEKTITLDRCCYGWGVNWAEIF